MSDIEKTEITYRDAMLPGMGRVKVPAHMSDEEVLAEMAANEAADSEQDQPSKD